ncbi:tat (twin-arginine translocation) pathway signal sequence [Streptomyces sp. SPB074]|nr:tat (twin-arginine translocation) pathway signal sequence [Streptomyces sp. SPB074]
MPERGGPQPGKGFGELDLPAAAAPREPHHLPLAHAQRHVRVALAREPGDVQHEGRVGGHLVARGVLRGGDGLARHRLDQRGTGQFGHRGRGDPAGVAQDGDGLAHLVHLLEVVRDEQEGDARLLQRPHPGEETVDLTAVELCRGLVQDDEAGPDAERAGDLHHLPVLDAQVPGAGPRIDVDVPVAEERGGLGAQPAPGDEAAAPGGLPVQEQVLGDGEVGDDGGLLVDAGDLGAPGRAVGEAGGGGAVEADLAAVGGLEPGEERDEGGLARAVAPDEGVRLARPDGETSVGEGDGGAVALAHRAGLGERRRALGACGACGACGAAHFAVFPHSFGSSTFSFVTSGAGSWSSRFPEGVLTMRRPQVRRRR